MAVIIAFAWFIVRSEPIRAVYTGVLILLLALEFFIYTDRLNRDLNQFFMSILHDDYTSVFRERSRGKSFRQLYSTLNDITLKFRSISKEKEMRGQYLFSLIEQVKVGIISFEPDGRVNLVNRAFREMLDVPAVHSGSDIKEQEPELFSILKTITDGEKQLLRRKIRDEEKEFSFDSAGFKMEDKFYNLVSVQDIREELDNRELEAWQKLIRVLTHEIMNSVSPIASLTGSLHDLVSEPTTDAGEELLRGKLSMGLTAIQERSAGLLKFTEAYQKLSRIPAPVITDIQTKSLVERIEILFKPQFESSNLRFSINIQKAPVSFNADLDLLEQVIINLVRNATDAVANTPNPEIDLMIESRHDGKISIIVRDNGTGIPEAQLDRIFIPFFSTKEKGSGIGLSLSRQVILMHKGT
ncbi:MAG: ATP-binding protein, partial [Bacteroidales bacterium]|nr:ATP-binding protein [Bacteroidales bacterium]